MFLERNVFDPLICLMFQLLNFLSFSDHSLSWMSLCVMMQRICHSPWWLKSSPPSSRPHANRAKKTYTDIWCPNIAQYSAMQICYPASCATTESESWAYEL